MFTAKGASLTYDERDRLASASPTLGGTSETLRAEGHDVLWARTDCIGWKDAALLELAESQARVVITLDKDFWQIALQRRIGLEQPGVVLFRVHPAIPFNIAGKMGRVPDLRPPADQVSHIAVSRPIMRASFDAVPELAVPSRN